MQAASEFNVEVSFVLCNGLVLDCDEYDFQIWRTRHNELVRSYYDKWDEKRWTALSNQQSRYGQLARAALTHVPELTRLSRTVFVE